MLSLPWMTKGQRDEQEVLNREFHDSNLEFGDQFGEKSCKTVQGHGQHEHHQLLGLISGLLVDC